MKYIWYVIAQRDMNAMSKKDADAGAGETPAYDDPLRKAGPLVITHALPPLEPAAAIRGRNGPLSTTDGLFAETKEPLRRMR